MTVIVDNTGFNVDYWSRFNETEFIEQNIRHGVFKQLPESERHWLLKEAYKLIVYDPALTTKKT